MKATITLELDDATLDAIADRLTARLRPAVAVEPSKGSHYVTRKEATTQFKVELKALLHAEKSGAIEAFRPGRKVVYRTADVIALVEACQVASPADRCVVVDLPAPTDPFELARLRRRSGAR